MGKILFEFVIPFLLLGTLAWWGVKLWFFRFFGKSITSKIDIDKQAKKYDNKLNKST